MCAVGLARAATIEARSSFQRRCTSISRRVPWPLGGGAGAGGVSAAAGGRGAVRWCTMRVTGRASGARGGIGRVGGRGAAITAVTSGSRAMRWCMGWTSGRAAVVAPAGVLAAAAPIITAPVTASQPRGTVR